MKLIKHERTISEITHEITLVLTKNEIIILSGVLEESLGGELCREDKKFLEKMYNIFESFHQEDI